MTTGHRREAPWFDLTWTVWPNMPDEARRVQEEQGVRCADGIAFAHANAPRVNVPFGIGLEPRCRVCGVTHRELDTVYDRCPVCRQFHVTRA